MAKKINILNFTLWVLAFMSIVCKVEAQVEFSATLKNDFLKLKFCNKSESDVKVPDLRSRFGLDKVYLHENYYYLSNDTLFLNLKEDVDEDMYSIKSAEPYKGQIEANMKYLDKVLSSGKSYSSKIKIRDLKDVRIIVLNYNDLLFESTLE